MIGVQTDYGRAVPGAYPFLPMTQAAYDRNGGVQLVSDDGGLEPSELEKKLVGVPEPAKSEIRKGNESIRHVKKVLDDYIRSGDYKSLQKYWQAIGYRSDITIDTLAADSTRKGVVAFTDGEKLLGVNTRFKEAVSNVAKDAGVKVNYAEEYIIAHELTHMAQPEGIKSDAYTAESDVELRLAEHFYMKSKGIKDSGKKGAYMNLAKFALSRYFAIQSGAIGTDVKNMLLKYTRK